MSNTQATINDIAYGLHRVKIIDKKTLRELTDDDLPEIIEYAGEEIQLLRKSKN